MDGSNQIGGAQPIPSSICNVLGEYDIIASDNENTQNYLNDAALDNLESLKIDKTTANSKEDKTAKKTDSGNIQNCKSGGQTEHSSNDGIKKSDSLNPLYEYQNSSEENNSLGELKKDSIPVSNSNSNADAQMREEYKNERCIEIVCPRVNCPEKIIFCLDLSSEMDRPIFRSRVGDKFSPLQLVKRALGIFTQTKSRMNKKHQFGLVVLQSSATWVRDFTANPKDMITILEDLNDTYECEPVDGIPTFDSIFERIQLPVIDGDVTVLPPPHVIRTIFIYGRSHQHLQWNTNEIPKCFDSPYVFIDVLYVHEPLSDENKCEEIFDQLCELDYKGLSYIFEASKSPTKIYDHMAQLLAHPCQRPLQRDISNRIKLPEVPEAQIPQLPT